MMLGRLRPCTTPCPLVHRRLTNPITATAQQRVDELFHNATAQSPLLMLERSIRPNALDSSLWNTSAFAAQVYPDIPLVTSWKDLQRLWPMAGSVTPSDAGIATPRAAQDGRWMVNTVGVQTRRTTEQLRQALLAKAGEHGSNADALLVVSGSHLMRRVPGAKRVMSDSVAALKLASTMRAQGPLPRSLALWCVDNPLLQDGARLEAKVEAGAQVVLTQPPLLWGAFERWIADIQRRGLLSSVRLVVGVPMLSSASNAAFWLQLCQAAGQPGAEALVAGLRAREAATDGSPEALRQLYDEVNRDLVHQVLEVPSVVGLHVMPLTTLARQLTMDMLADGAFGRPVADKEADGQ